MYRIPKCFINLKDLWLEKIFLLCISRGYSIILLNPILARIVRLAFDPTIFNLPNLLLKSMSPVVSVLVKDANSVKQDGLKWVGQEWSIQMCCSMAASIAKNILALLLAGESKESL